MPTKFKKFISMKYFPIFFTCVYCVMLILSALETKIAWNYIFNGKYTSVPVYILFALTGILVILNDKMNLKIKNCYFKKAMGFLCCYFIYALPLTSLWFLINLVFPVSPSMRTIVVFGLKALICFIIAYGYINTKKIKIKKYNTSIKNSKNRYHIVLISDIHLGIFVSVKHIKKVVTMINSLRPDIVVVAGDIFNGDKLTLQNPLLMEKICNEFSKLNTKEGVYAVVGNHDPKATDDTFRKFLADANIELLDDEVKILSEISLIGRTDGTNNNRKHLIDILPYADPWKPKVVIDHMPENIDEAENYHIDLVLCGHTHRGQFFPLNILASLTNGKRRFYGYHKSESTHCIITSGVGFFGLPMRLGSSNEIADIHLN